MPTSRCFEVDIFFVKGLQYSEKFFCYFSAFKVTKPVKLVLPFTLTHTFLELTRNFEAFSYFRVTLKYAFFLIDTN